MASVIEGPLHVTQGLTCDTFNAPQNSIGNEAVNASNPINTDKIKHLHMVCQGQMDGGSTYTEIRPIYVAFTSGKVQQFQVGQRVAITGNSEVTVDLHKNGVSVLSAVPTLNTTFTPDAYDQIVAGVDPTKENYVPGDVFEVVVTVTEGTGTPGEGLFFQTAFNESPF